MLLELSSSCGILDLGFASPCLAVLVGLRYLAMLK